MIVHALDESVIQDIGHAFGYYGCKDEGGRGGTHKTVLEMFSGNGVACGLCRFSILQVIQ